jgi:hypothetical protein
VAQEVGSQFSTRIEGTCVKHRFGKSSIKMYDKSGIALRIETTTNDVSFFKHHRRVEHRDSPPTRALAPVADQRIGRVASHAARLCGQCLRQGQQRHLRIEVPPRKNATDSRSVVAGGVNTRCTVAFR